MSEPYCYDCGRPYGLEHGFPDLVVAHEVWERISPSRDGHGLLCPSCMCHRAHKSGIKCEAIFRSGPFVDLRDEKDRRIAKLEAAMRAVLLFHSGGLWTPERVTKWVEIVGPQGCTTKVLCDHLRVALREDGVPVRPQCQLDELRNPNYDSGEVDNDE